MSLSLGSVLIYARDMERTAAFYVRFFGFESSGTVVEGLITLTSPRGGASIVIHQAAKSVKLGQVGVKLVFDVRDVDEFKVQSAALGLAFGATHLANGYSFANAKDPHNWSSAQGRWRCGMSREASRRAC